MLKILFVVPLILLAACSRDGEIDPTGGVSVTRSACPAVGIPADTGDITLFDPPASRDARAIDVVATMTNVRSTCDESGSEVVANATFDVQARRTNTQGARDVTIPYFTTIIRGGNTVVAKRVRQVVVRFADGAARATAQAGGGSVITRSSATLPKEVIDKLRKKRKPTDADASIDPMTAPDVREAVARANFELLVGFQLTQAQLQYNVTR